MELPIFQLLLKIWYHTQTVITELVLCQLTSSGICVSAKSGQCMIYAVLKVKMSIFNVRGGC